MELLHTSYLNEEKKKNWAQAVFFIYIFDQIT